MSTRQGLHGGVGILAEPTVASPSVTPTINNTFFNMLKSPRDFELNSLNSGIHGKIKRRGLDYGETARGFRKSEHSSALCPERPAFSSSQIRCMISGVWYENRERPGYDLRSECVRRHLAQHSLPDPHCFWKVSLPGGFAKPQ